MRYMRYSCFGKVLVRLLHEARGMSKWDRDRGRTWSEATLISYTISLPTWNIFQTLKKLLKLLETLNFPNHLTYCDSRLYICMPITYIVTPACGIAAVAGAQRHKVFETLQTFIAPKFLLSHLCIKITRFIKSTWSCLELFHQKKFSFHFWTFTNFVKLCKLWWTQNTSYIFCASKWIHSEIQFEVV